MESVMNVNQKCNTNFFRKWYHYQKERFPILAHGILIFAFGFSAISYALMCNGEKSFISYKIFFPGIIVIFTLFLLLRILDEFKDAADDKMYRPHLPVPRGLIKLKELKVLGILLLVIQLLIHLLVFPKMIFLYVIVLVYLSLMTKEFFIADWLRKHQFWYVTSHMMIIPFIDIYASGLYWYQGNRVPPNGLLFFFGVSFFNGLVLEIGRKIKAPDEEALGVSTYSSMLGPIKAVFLWLVVLLTTYCISLKASSYTGNFTLSLVPLSIVLCICLFPAILYFFKPKSQYGKMIEYASGLWTIVMYLSLGGILMLKSLLQG
jgi:4-hydroxybenzoate polyprenyltransferase